MSLEAVGKLISSTKKLSTDEEDLKKELALLKTELKDEERNLKDLQMENKQLNIELGFIQNKIQTNNNASEMLKELREGLRSTSVLLGYFFKFIENAEPSLRDQAEEVTKIRNRHETIMKKYEASPGYQAVLQEEANEKELAKLIDEKNIEIMKLETKLVQY